MKFEKISQGPTFKGAISTIGFIFFVLGLIITLAGIFSDSPFNTVTVGMLFLILGLPMLLSIRGVLIDMDKKLIKPYFDIFIAKFGDWEPLDPYDKIELRYTSESQTMNSRGSSTDYLTRTFDIVLTSKSEDELYLKEFIDYKNAKDFMLKYSSLLNKTGMDTYEIIRHQIQERKHTVRR